MDELRVGLVGCGRLAERGYVAAIARAGGIRLAAVADPYLERCAAAAPGIEAFTSASELVSAGLADVVILATPVDAHLPDARLAAAAGLPTLVEKPPAADAAGAAALAALDPAPWLGFNRRFERGLAALRRRIPPGAPLELRLEFQGSAGWRPYSVRDELLLDLGPHLVDLCCWLTGAAPTGVEARLEAGRATLRLELDGGRVRARIVCSTRGRYRESVVAEGPAGPIGGYRAGGPAGLLRRDPLVPSLTSQLEAFARAARGGDPGALATAAEGVPVLAALDAAARSAARGGTREPVA